MKRRLVWIAPIVFAALTFARPAVAQKPAPAEAPKPAAPQAPKPAPTLAPVSPAQSAAAMELFRTIKLQAEVPNVSAAMIDSEIGRNPGLTPYRDIMLGWLRRYMTWDAMVPQLTRLYADSFTEAELKELNAFYKTPTGQKALTKMPELMQRTAMIGAQLGQPHSDELKKLMTARSEELAKQQEKAQAGVPGKAPAPKPPAATPKKP